MARAGCWSSKMSDAVNIYTYTHTHIHIHTHIHTHTSIPNPLPIQPVVRRSGAHHVPIRRLCAHHFHGDGNVLPILIALCCRAHGLRQIRQPHFAKLHRAVGGAGQVCICACVRACVRACVYVCVHVCVCAFASMKFVAVGTHTHAHRHTHSHTHTHTHTCPVPITLTAVRALRGT